MDNQQDPNTTEPQAPERFKCNLCEEIIDTHIAATHLQGKHPEQMFGQSVTLETNENPKETTETVQEAGHGRDNQVITDSSGVLPQAEAIKGEIVEKHPGGRPTKYNEEMYNRTKQYFEDCLYGVKDANGKLIKGPRTPFTEEIELMLDVDDQTIRNWTKEHPEFFGTYNKIKTLQKLRLKQILVKGKSNPLGPKFLLSAEHGLIDSEKKILAGEQNQPLQIEITEEDKQKHLLNEATS